MSASTFIYVEVERLYCREAGVSWPMPRYFVTLVDDEGCALFGVWDGDSYLEALEAASEWKLPTLDKTRGRA